MLLNPDPGELVTASPTLRLAPPPEDCPLDAAPSFELRDQLEALASQVRVATRTALGFPATKDEDWTVLTSLAWRLTNNVGDPYDDDDHGDPRHTRGLERAALEAMAALHRAPSGWWGYIDNGTASAIATGLRIARARLPHARAVFSAAAHTCVPGQLDALGIPGVPIATDPGDAMDLAVLREQLDENDRANGVIVVATAGTTMSEALDDVDGIHAVLDAAQVPREARHIHLDAALDAIPLAVHPLWHPRVRMGHDAAHTVSSSTHKWPGTPVPGGVLLADGADVETLRRTVPYIRSRQVPLTSSRSGLPAAALWWSLHRHGARGHHARAETQRALAALVRTRLQAGGIAAGRHEHALTVTFPTPAEEIVDRWRLAVHGDTAHLITMPGTDHDALRRCVQDLLAHRRTRVPAPRQVPLGDRAAR